MRALVTGCAGFIGGHLAEALLATGVSVVGVDNFLHSYETQPRHRTIKRLSESAGFRMVELDLADGDLDSLMSGVSVIYHLAAKPGVRSSWQGLSDYLRSNVLGTQRLFDAARRRENVKVVFASSSSVYGSAETFPTPESAELRPISPYGVTKAAGEQLAYAYGSEFGLEVVTLRYSTVFGPRQRSDMAFHIWIRSALEEREITVFGDGFAIRDFTYVDDAVRATIAASQLPGGSIVNVAGGSPASLNDALALIGEHTSGGLMVRHVEKARGDPPRTGGDTTRIRTLTDWSPTMSLRDGLSREVDWMVGYLQRSEA